MNSGSSASISSGSQSAETRRHGSWYQTSRPSLPGDLAAGAAHDDAGVHAGTSGTRQRLVGVAFSGTLRPPRTPSSAVITHLALGVVDAVGERVGREAAEDDGVHRADARAGQHRVGRLGDHRQVDADPVALLDAAGLQHVGELADLGVQLAIGDLRSSFGSSPSQMIAVWSPRSRGGGRGSCSRDVERAVLEPFDAQDHLNGSDLNSQNCMPYPLL
jgi:hypothetical protein